MGHEKRFAMEPPESAEYVPGQLLGAAASGPWPTGWALGAC